MGKRSWNIKEKERKMRRWIFQLLRKKGKKEVI